MNPLRKLRRRFRDAWYKRGYYIPDAFRKPIPPPRFDLIPDGFSVHHIGNTGVIAVENFCTQEEAAYLIDKARTRLQPSSVVNPDDDSLVYNTHRKSADAGVYGYNDKDPLAQRFVERAAMLLGVPTTHAENFPVTYYDSGDYFKEHMDAFPSFNGDRQYTVLVYLNDVGDGNGGETVFTDLGIVSKPRICRAIIWRNYNNDGSVNMLSKHSAQPLKERAEKWVVQLGFRRYPMFEGPERKGEPELQPLSSGDALPEGVEKAADAASN